MGIDAELLLYLGDTPSISEVKRLGWLLANSIGAEHFQLDKAAQQGALSLVWESTPGQATLKANVKSSYYGVGYERGDLLTLCAIAEWCEMNIPNCTVWYGGDSRNTPLKPWPEDERRKLKAHLYSINGRSFYGLKRQDLSGNTPRPCALCIGAGRFIAIGAGMNGLYKKAYCGGCGENFETYDAGHEWRMIEK